MHIIKLLVIYKIYMNILKFHYKFKLLFYINDVISLVINIK